MSKDKTFEKYKLVPFDESKKPFKTSSRSVNNSPTMLAKAQKYLRDYDPTLRAKTNAFIGMRKALFGRQTGWTARKRLDVLNSNMARYKHLASDSPLEEDSQTQQETPRLGAVNDYTEVKPLNEELEGLKTEDDELKPLVNIPKPYRAKFQQMRTLSSKTIKRGKAGEIVIRGTPVPNSSYSDVMRAMFVSPKGDTPLPDGLPEALTELKRLKASPSVLSATRARVLYSKTVVPEQTGSGRSKPTKLKSDVTVKNKKSAKILRLY